MKNIVSIILALCMFFAMACGLLCGCDNNSGSGGQTGDLPTERDAVTPINKGKVEGTVHVFNAAETGDYLVKNGKSEYQILVPTGYKSVDYLNNAANDLQQYLFESTKAKLPITEDSAYDRNGKYISLGDTALAKEMSITVNPVALTSQGYTIKTINKNIFISGATSFAILWGVYGLLDYECGFDWFYGSTYSLEKKDSIKLKNYDFTDIPDIEMRFTNYGSSTYTGTYRKMRFVYEPEVMIWGVHSSLNVLPYETYSADHPKWYAATQNQLCYNAHGDADELESLIETVSDLLVEEFVANPEKRLACFSDFDNMDYCTCQACEGVVQKYGQRSANQVLFTKKFAARVEQKLRAIGDARADTFSIAFLAYNRADVAPVNVTVNNTTGEMTFDYNQDLKCDNHVCAWYAPIGACFEVSILDDINFGLYKNLYAWNELCSLGVYAYDLNVRYYLLPHDTTDALADLYKCCRESNCQFMLNQGQTYAVASTGWSYLKNYLTSKLCWDVNADVNALIKKFFINMYGSQGEKMLQLYEEYHALAEIQSSVFMCPKGLSAAMLNANYWPENLLLNWINKMYDMENALINNNESLMYVQNIQTELLAYLYLYIELYENKAQSSVIHEYAQKFVSIATSLGFSWESEVLPIDALIEEYSTK